MTYDTADQIVLLFGGVVQTGPTTTAYSNGTWGFYRGAWHHLNTTSAPTPRAGAAMAYDPADREVILFGGYSAGFRTLIFNDTWTFHAGKWTQVYIPYSPSGRYDGGMAFDHRDGYLVLYGGCSGALCFPLPTDTWRFLHGNWTNITGPIGPPALDLPSMAYDSVNRCVILFGGVSPNASKTAWTQSNATWKFVNGSWSRVRTHGSPPGMSSASMADDRATDSLLLFGGQTSTSTCAALVCGATWNYSSGRWTNVTPSSGPSPRYGAVMVYDPLNRGILLFGGIDPGPRSIGILGDTWLYR